MNCLMLEREFRRRVDMALDRWLPPAGTHPARLHAAIRYAVMGGGKRLRPLLTYASAQWLGVPPERVDAIAVALEMVHAYSLVHDDLPALDDDDLRRGRPATHRAFDEATAILVGDALQVHAYLVLARDGALDLPAAARCQLVLDLAAASGSAGLAGGQALDMEATGTLASAEQMEAISGLKTACLLEAAVVMPCRLQPGLESRQLDAARRFGRACGLAFQLADDLLDIEVPVALSGKPQGSDRRNGKPTLAALLGPATARQRLAGLQGEALDALAAWGSEADFLRWLTSRIHPVLA